MTEAIALSYGLRTPLPELWFLPTVVVCLHSCANWVVCPHLLSDKGLCTSTSS